MQRGDGDRIVAPPQSAGALAQGHGVEMATRIAARSICNATTATAVSALTNLPKGAHVDGDD